MTWEQAITIIASTLFPMLVGIAWMVCHIDKKIEGLHQRFSRMEGYNEGRNSILRVKGE